MKGIIFTEFIEMVEETFSWQVADQIIEAADLPSRGVYTSLGTYSHGEIIQLVIQLSQVTGIVVPDLVRAFGKHLFGRFVANYPQFFEGINSTFDFLANVNGYIHVEVRKLYPDAQLPTFECDHSESNRFIMIYRSTRPFADLAEGLITGCIEHFNEKISLQREDLLNGKEPGTAARFILGKQS